MPNTVMTRKEVHREILAPLLRSHAALIQYWAKQRPGINIFLPGVAGAMGATVIPTAEMAAEFDKLAAELEAE